MSYFKKPSSARKFDALLPVVRREIPRAEICTHCNYVNKTDYSFCTNCGYPLHNEQLVDIYHKRVQQKTDLLFKAESSVLVARIVLYIMASFLLLGIFFIFSEGNQKYLLPKML